MILSQTSGIMFHRRRKRFSRALILRWLIPALPLFYVVYCTGMYFFQDWILFPRMPAPAEPRLFTPTTERHFIELVDGNRVEGWFCPTPAASNDHPAPVLFFFHGNLEVIDDSAAWVAHFNQLGCSVFLMEYRGYGRSAVEPTERGIIEDAVRFHDTILTRPDVDRSRIAYYGNSLGAAFAVSLAAQRAPKAMVLGAAFTNVSDMARRFYTPSFLVRFRLDTQKTLGTLNVPVLIAHCADDNVVPVEQGRRLRDVARRATYVEYPTGGHLGFNRNEAYWDRVTRFLTDAGVVSQKP